MGKKLAAALAFGAIFSLAIFVYFNFIDIPSIPKPFEKEKRVFSIGTRERLYDYLGASFVYLELSDVNESGAHGSFNIMILKRENATLQGTLVFVLPANVSIERVSSNWFLQSEYYVSSKDFATVVDVPFFLDEGQSSAYKQVEFFWPTLSKSSGWQKWSFELEVRQYHQLLLDEGEPFVVLPVYLNDDSTWYTLLVVISLSSEENTIVEFHPGTDFNWDQKVEWYKESPPYWLEITTEYENKVDRYWLSVSKDLSFASLTLFSGALITMEISRRLRGGAHVSVSDPLSSKKRC